MAASPPGLTNVAPLLQWQLRSTGNFAIIEASSGRDVTPRGRKARAIVAYLASRPDSQVSRERIAELLWGDRGEAQARASLRQALFEIRREARDLVQTDRGHLWIEACRATIDEADTQWVEAFDDLNHITPEFDDWLAAERSQRSQSAWNSLRIKIEKLLADGRRDEPKPLIDQMRQIDPFNEEWARLAMRTEFLAGHPAGIDRQFKEIAGTLKAELGVDPTNETRALRDRLIAELTWPAATPDGVPQPTIEARVPLPRGRKRVAVASAAMVIALAGATVTMWPRQSEPPRLAVLPFESAGIEPSLAEGLSDELLSQLSRNQGLRVIGRTSSAQFKGKAADLRSVGRKLDVEYVVEGTVRSSGEQMQIAVSLVNVRDGSAIWAQTYKGTPDALQPIQAAIGSAIGRSLNIGSIPVAKRATDGRAFELYLRAKSLIRERNFDSASKAVELLRQALRIDPTFAAGWAQLAAAIHFSGERDTVVEPDGKPIRMSKREAAERALALDPDLSEAHAMVALFDGGGFSTAKARAHLRRALELNPGDTQTLFWSGHAAAAMGDSTRAGAIYRRAATLDPLWKRPVGAAVAASLSAGDRAAALSYLRTIKAGNPAAATEIEINMAFSDGDFSRVVALAFADGKAPRDLGKAVGIQTLISLGFVREALLMSGYGQFERATVAGHAPPLSDILKVIRNNVAAGDDFGFCSCVIWELAREGRWSDLAAIYDANLGLMQDMRGRDPGGRGLRLTFGPMLALALNRAGRKREAEELALTADEAARTYLANGEVPASSLVLIAGNEAVLGRKSDALTHLEQAFAKGWRADAEITSVSRIGEVPVFATLRGDPRFERLRRIQVSHIARERRETQALGIM